MGLIIGSIISIVTAVFFAVVALFAHEGAHVFAVRYFGGKVDRVGLLPLGFTAKFSGLQNLDPWERYVVYGAGSIANGFIWLWAFSVSRISYFGIGWLEEFAFYNLVLCIFNLLPIIPLDGGQILRQFIGNRFGLRPANRFMLKLGKGFSIVLIALGLLQVVLYYNITLFCAAIYLYRKNKNMQPALELEFFEIVGGKKDLLRARLMPVRKVHINGQLTIRQAMDRLTIDHFTQFVVSNQGGDGVTYMTEGELVGAICGQGILLPSVNFL